MTVRLFPMSPRPARDVRVGVEREDQPVRRHAVGQLVERVEHRVGAAHVLLTVEAGEESITSLSGVQFVDGHLPDEVGKLFG